MNDTGLFDIFRRKLRSFAYIVISKCEQGRHNPIRSLLGDAAYFRFKSLVAVFAVKGKYRTHRLSGPLKTVVSVFNGDVYNPGLADRLRSIASVYYWCKTNGIDYKIHFTYPFVLQDYLTPNKVDWVCENLDYTSAVPEAVISYLGIFGEEKNRSLHLAALENLKNVKCPTVHLYSNTCCNDDWFYECFNELFTPSRQLESEIQMFQQEIGGEYITLSFRFTQLLGDMKDTVGEPLPEDERARLIETCRNSIKDIMSRNDVSKCVVTSDSVTFINEVSSLPYVFIIPGAIGHVANDVSEAQVRKTFWDMFIISRAKKAYMVRTPAMYRSGFASRSAMIGNVPFEEVVI